MKTKELNQLNSCQEFGNFFFFEKLYLNNDEVWYARELLRDNSHLRLPTKKVTDGILAMKSGQTLENSSAFSTKAWYALMRAS